MKILKYTKLKNKTNVGCVIGEDGDLFIAFEGGIPIRAREMLELYYKYSKQAGDMWYLERLEQRRSKRIENRFREMELTNLKGESK